MLAYDDCTNRLSCVLGLSQDFGKFLEEFAFYVSFFSCPSNYHCIVSRIIMV